MKQQSGWSKWIVHDFFYKYICWIQFPIVILVNLAVAAIILKYPSLRKIRSNKIFCVLLLSHILLAVWGLGESWWVRLSSQIVWNHMKNKDRARSLWASVFGILQFFNFSSMIWVSTDRFLAIRTPFFYQRLSKKQLAGIIATIYGTPPIITYIALVSSDFHKAFFVGYVISFLGPVCIIFTHASVYRNVKLQFKTIHRNSISKDAQQQEQERKKVLRRQLRSLCISLLLTITYLIFWLPVLSFFFVLFFTDKEVEDAIPIILYAIILMNSIADPIIYGYFNRSIRSVLFKRRQQRQQ